MPSTMAYRQGDIVLVSFPFTDLTSSKRRPALVLSPDSFNAAGEDLVLAAVTSHITDDPNAVHLWRGDFAEGRLPKPSMVKATKLFTMHSSLIAKRIGALRTEKMKEVLRSLRGFFSGGRIDSVRQRRTGSTAKGRGEIAMTATVHLKERAKGLEPFGWTGRGAEWIALACFHGGVFTRAQWTDFLGCHHEKVRRAVHRLVAQGVAVEETPPGGIAGIGRICRIHGRRIYRALGAGDRRRRRTTSTGVLMRRLLSLDYVLEHPHLPWLPTEPEKVSAFEALGIDCGILPQRVYRGAAGNIRRHFPLRLPVALDTEHAVFVYVDSGHETAMALRSWGWRTANSGRRSGIAAAGSKWWPLAGPGRRRAGRRRCSLTGSAIPPLRNRRGDRSRHRPNPPGNPGRGCPGPPGVRRFAGRHEAQCRAGKAGAQTGGEGAEAPHRHMAEADLAL